MNDAKWDPFYAGFLIWFSSRDQVVQGEEGSVLSRKVTSRTRAVRILRLCKRRVKRRE